jgi:predicted secreted protein
VAAADGEVVASGAQDTAAPAAAAVEETVAAGAQKEEAPAEGGLVDIASILGAPAMTIVRSNL